MRLDQFLQKTGILKRRSLAKEYCDKGSVSLNKRTAKASHDVSQGDMLEVKFTDRRCHYKVLGLPVGNVKKEARNEYVEMTSEELFHSDD
jgi:ribosomal 50S subunit-recycling heat shock protein